MDRKEVEKSIRSSTGDDLKELLVAAIIFMIFGALQGLMIKIFFPYEDNSEFYLGAILSCGFYTFIFSYLKLLLNKIPLFGGKYGNFYLESSFITPILYAISSCAGVYLFRNTSIEPLEYLALGGIIGVMNLILMFIFGHENVIDVLESFDTVLIVTKKGEYRVSLIKIAVVCLILSLFSWIPAFILIHYEFKFRYILMACFIAFAFYAVVNLIVNMFMSHEEKILSKMGLYDEDKTNYTIHEIKNGGAAIYNFIAPVSSYIILLIGYKSFVNATIGTILLYINHISYREFTRKYKKTGETNVYWSDGEVGKVVTYEENKED